MVNRNHRSRPRHSATLNDARSDKELYTLVATALTQCITEEGVSVRQAAAAFRVSANTVQRWKRVGFLLPILRSRRLALCFVSNLKLLLTIRNGRAGYVLRARRHPKRLRSSYVARKRSKRAGQRRHAGGE